MALGDVYQVVVEQRLFGQAVLNAYYYEERLSYIDTNPTHAQTVAERFEELVVPSLLVPAPTDLQFERLTVKNLFDPADGYTLVLGATGTGQAGGDVDTAFSSVSVELVGETTATRRGAKRFAGVVDEMTADGVINIAGAIVMYQGIADALVVPLTVGVVVQDPVFRPCIVKRVREGVPGDYVYRLPETIGEKVTNLVVATLLDLVITSQVSRKIGVGS